MKTIELTDEELKHLLSLIEAACLNERGPDLIDVQVRAKLEKALVQ